jgi:hypothetical protein
MNQKIIALEDQMTGSISEKERAEKEEDILIFKAAIHYSGSESFLEPHKRTHPQEHSKEKEEKGMKIVCAKTEEERDKYIDDFLDRIFEKAVMPLL